MKEYLSHLSDRGVGEAVSQAPSKRKALSGQDVKGVKLVFHATDVEIDGLTKKQVSMISETLDALLSLLQQHQGGN